MNKAVLAILIAAAGLSGWVLWHVAPASGALSAYEQRLVEDCVRVDVHPGTEDATIDPDTNLVFVSASDRRAAIAGAPVRGGIFTVDLGGGYRVARVSPDAPADFQPHGISLWRGPGGEKRLFVINHPIAGGHSVEIFEVGDRGALTYAETVSFDAMHSPNDVVAVGPRAFYATNDRGFVGGVLETLEAYLALPFASVVHFDGTAGRVVEPGLVYANGINVSADGATIYVAELLKRRIAVFSRDVESGELHRVRNASVDTNPDNIEVARDGALWIAGHPKIFDFLKHAGDADAVAPSHVIRVSPRTWEATDVFYDGSGAINGSSVGAVWDKTLIVGAVFDGHVMACPMLEIFLRAPDA